MFQRLVVVRLSTITFVFYLNVKMFSLCVALTQVEEKTQV